MQFQWSVACDNGLCGITVAGVSSGSELIFLIPLRAASMLSFFSSRSNWLKSSGVLRFFSQSEPVTVFVHKLTFIWCWIEYIKIRQLHKSMYRLMDYLYQKYDLPTFQDFYYVDVSLVLLLIWIWCWRSYSIWQSKHLVAPGISFTLKEGIMQSHIWHFISPVLRILFMHLFFLLVFSMSNCKLKSAISLAKSIISIGYTS